MKKPLCKSCARSGELAIRDFVADESLGFELWEAPDVFRAGSFARPIIRRKRPKDSDQTAAGARASAPFWENHNLSYEDRDIINNPFNYTEMLEKRGAEPFALCRGQRAHAWPMSTGTK